MLQSLNMLREQLERDGVLEYGSVGSLNPLLHLFHHSNTPVFKYLIGGSSSGLAWIPDKKHSGTTDLSRKNGALQYWGIGFSITPLLHHSSTPFFRR